MKRVWIKLFFLGLLIFGLIQPLWAQPSSCPRTSQEWVSFLTGPQSARVPIVFIHGIAAGFEKWDKAAAYISGGQAFTMRFQDNLTITHNYYGKKPSVWVWNVSYYSPDVLEESLHGNLTLYAGRLGKMLNEIGRITSSNQFVLVAHSMGGLVAQKYIVLHPQNYQRVYSFLSVGTPHTGVPFSLPVGQLKDLQRDSDFLIVLNKEWNSLLKTRSFKWGVIGGISPNVPTADINENTTDAGGPGFIPIKSAIPFGGWKYAVSRLGRPLLNTPHFGFCGAVRATHDGLLVNSMVFEGVFWAVGCW
jgi:pimeloyl-ACP methyl ester carboxylesterase